jgi:hypothetical protein
LIAVAEAVPEAIVKSHYSAIVSAVVWYTHGSRSSTRRYSYCLRSGSVISTSSSSIGECKGIRCNSRRLLLNSNTAGLPSVAEAGVIVATVAASLSLIVPVAEAFQRQCKVSLFSIVSAVVGTKRFPVAPAGTVTVCEVVV